MKYGLNEEGMERGLEDGLDVVGIRRRELMISEWRKRGIVKMGSDGGSVIGRGDRGWEKRGFMGS